MSTDARNSLTVWGIAILAALGIWAVHHLRVFDRLSREQFIVLQGVIFGSLFLMAVRAGARWAWRRIVARHDAWWGERVVTTDVRNSLTAWGIAILAALAIGANHYFRFFDAMSREQFIVWQSIIFGIWFLMAANASVRWLWRRIVANG